MKTLKDNLIGTEIENSSIQFLKFPNFLGFRSLDS